MTKVNKYGIAPMELAEYTRIQAHQSGINTCIYIDECKSFERWEHPMWAITSSGDPYVDSWVALSISNEPDILSINGEMLDGLRHVIEPCKQFVSIFHNLLAEIANEKYDSSLL